MADYNHIQAWLRPKLKAKGWSVEKLAKESGISRTMIYFYLDDTSRPTASNMTRICRALGVPPEEGAKQYTDKRIGRPRTKRKRSRR